MQHEHATHRRPNAAINRALGEFFRGVRRGRCLVVFSALGGLLAAGANAAPFVVADPIPLANAPSMATELRVDGGASIPCAWVLTTTTRQAACDLAGTDTSPTPARKYEARYTWASGVGGDGALYTAGASGWSLPLSVPWRTPAAPSTLSIAPSVAP